LRFDGDSSTIKTEFYPVLDEVYDFMLENGKIVIEVGGHTNNVPPDEYCDRLSTARAKAVADYLAAKGIDPKRVLFKGYGKRKPVASNTTPEGRVLNQRVEIKILSLGG
jgi:outer membrane protein OmpA-like peptidoglycan-associated protein